MNIRIKVDSSNIELTLSAKEIIKERGLKIKSVVFQLFKKLVNETEETIRFLYVD